ncbi:pilus assembly protein PilM [Metabacillus indicus]|uniref:type IV pilus biogenesis protein PilM n=1 Tax=Metabacillus indicus TaxID=246786 RepID=UPI002A033066|nr:pilus assembly protein PilM [Metabacillus indicus]MDX8290004.1 pilus assembly protein PilM [Metabacillus indicus]
MRLSGFRFSKKTGNFTIKDDAIRYAELKQAEPLMMGMCEERLLPEGLIRGGVIQDFDTLSLILDECVSEWGIKGRKVRFTVPDSHVVIRKVNVPGDLIDDEIRGHLYVEIGSSIHLPFDEAVFDYIVTGRTDKELHLLLFASSEELVRSYSDLFDTAGLKPDAADISPLCQYRFYLNQKPKVDHAASVMLIQYDLSGVNLSIFQQEQPVFMRNIEVEKNVRELDSMSGTMTVEDFRLQANEIIKEIDHVLNFYRFSLNQGNDEVSSFILTGDHPLLHEAERLLAERYDYPVDSLKNAQAESSNKTPLPASFYLTAGLALKEVR